ncbi:MAG: DUF5622 domain-containing protein [Acidilobaceae archaeon]
MDRESLRCIIPPRGNREKGREKSFRRRFILIGWIDLVLGWMGMGGKHGKYVYVRRSDGLYVKVRVLKSRDEKDSSRYIPVGPVTKNPPLTFQVISEDDLPEEVKPLLYKV